MSAAPWEGPDGRLPAIDLYPVHAVDHCARPRCRTGLAASSRLDSRRRQGRALPGARWCRRECSERTSSSEHDGGRVSRMWFSQPRARRVLPSVLGLRNRHGLWLRQCTTLPQGETTGNVAFGRARSVEPAPSRWSGPRFALCSCVRTSTEASLAGLVARRASGHSSFATRWTWRLRASIHNRLYVHL